MSAMHPIVIRRAQEKQIARLRCPACSSANLKRCDDTENLSARCIECGVKFIITNPSAIPAAKP